MKNNIWYKVGLVILTVAALSILGILVQANLVMWHHW